MPGGAQLSTVESQHRTFHRGVAHIGRQVAAALAHAHTRGIVHRDIKPSNLLLDTEGVVWVSDFGLAKVDDDALTRTGDILGTLRYMAPERFRGRGDARADLYSLGLTLYELLVLRPAFDSPDRVALCEQIKAVDPPRPRSIDPRIPRDLETIVLKAIEKDPGDRYASADAMAEDLRRFLDDEPILARRIGAPERYARWARRNPVIAALGGVLTALLVGVTIASVLVAGRMAALAEVNERAAESEHDAKLAVQAALMQAKAERREAERHRERAEQHLYTARIGQAEGSLRLFDSATARTLLDQCRPEPGGPDRRGWEWFYLDQWCHPELRTISLPTTADTQAVAVSPDGHLLAVGCCNPLAYQAGEHPPVPAYVLSLPDGRVRHELVGHKEYVFAVTFRPDGKCLVTLGAEGTIRVWDTGSGRGLRAIGLGYPVRVVRGEEYAGLHWSPDGRRLASALGDGMVRIWDPETGQETAQIAHRAQSVAWSPDGTRIASGGEFGQDVRIWDARDGRPRGSALRQPGSIRSLSWSPDGRRLAAVSWDNDRDALKEGLAVWDTARGERVLRVGHVTELRAVAFSPDGSLVATGGKEGIVRVFDAAAGQERAALFTGCNNVSGLAFSADGRRLYASGWGMGGVKVFDPDRDPRGRGVRHWLNQLAALTFAPDGLRVLGVAGDSGALASVDPFDGLVKVEQVLPVSDDSRWPRGDFTFSPDGRQLAAPTRRDRTVVGVWDVALGRSLAMLRGSGGPVTAVAFRPDGQALATAAPGGPKGWPVVTLWDVASGREIRTFQSERPDPVEALAWSGNGRKLAAGGQLSGPGWVTIWDAETRAVLGTLDRVGRVKFLAFHPDGTRLAIADFDDPAKVHLWDLAAGTSITKPGPRAVSCVGFTPDGKRLAALGYDGNVHLCDARTGDEVLVLRGFGPPPGSGGFTPRMAFSPDGSRLAGHYAIGQVLNLWDLGPGWGLAAKPEADDLAGWLRRSRALAGQGDVVGAEAAYTRARDIKGGDPSPWIEHAVSLWRRGDARSGQDALARALRSLPEDTGRWIDLGRLLARSGWTKESETALAKARQLAERRLSLAPDDGAAAAVLAEVLPDPDESRGWTSLLPAAVTSAAGATLTRLPDGSVLAGGLNPAADTYTVEAVIGLSEITAMRLEALPDPSLPHHGPGRDPANGNFMLHEIRLSTVTGSGARTPVHLTRGCAGFSLRSFGLRGVTGALDADPTTAWSIWPQVGRPHWAVFQAAQPFGTGPGMRLRVELASGHPRYAYHALGRFRLSVTNRPVPFFEPSLTRLKADRERHGLTRVGAAYYLLGEWAAAASILERAAARPDASALDSLLLVLARHHLGRPDEARSDCDRALERLESDLADEATRDVAVEALITIRGLSVDEAEALLLDLVFPAEPFAP
jgi:WD40 repeat protein